MTSRWNLEFRVSRSMVKVILTFKLGGHTCFTNISCYCFCFQVLILIFSLITSVALTLGYNKTIKHWYETKESLTKDYQKKLYLCFRDDDRDRKRERSRSPHRGDSKDEKHKSIFEQFNIPKPQLQINPFTGILSLQKVFSSQVFWEHDLPSTHRNLRGVL